MAVKSFSVNISFLLKYPLMIIVLICGGASSYEDNTRSANKQTPQQNFAYAKCKLLLIQIKRTKSKFMLVFAFTDDGKIYRLEKRETNGLPTDLFAFKEPSYKGEFAFALVKRSSGFAKRSVPKGNQFWLFPDMI